MQSYTWFVKKTAKISQITFTYDICDIHLIVKCHIKGVFMYDFRYFFSIYLDIITHLLMPTLTTAGHTKYLALCSENLPELLLQQLKRTHDAYHS